ncbi:MAG: hypothetical protein R2818_13875 [Flavobacteriales bacterium]
MKSKVDLVQDIVVPWSLYGAFIGALVGIGVGWGLADTLNEGVVLPLCILPALLVGTLVGYHYSAKEVEGKLRQRALYERKMWAERKARRQAEMDRERKRAIVELERIVGLKDGMIERARMAAGHLAQAHRDLHDHLFASFWDHVEITANDLVAYHRALVEIGARVAAYEEGRKQAFSAWPDVLAVFNTMPDHDVLVEDLKKLVRTAHGRDDLERVFQCRRSNAILVPGPGTLGNVLNDLGDRLKTAAAVITKITGPLDRSQVHEQMDHSPEQRSERSKAHSSEDPMNVADFGPDPSLGWSKAQIAKRQERAGLLDEAVRKRSTRTGEELTFW